jgi:hypothetical protein
MRAFMISSLLGIAAAGGAAVVYRDRLPFKMPPATAPAPAPPKLSAKEIDDCRDRCEQHATVEASDEKSLRECRARCDGQGAQAAQPRETPSRITVAPVRQSGSRVAPAATR